MFTFEVTIPLSSGYNLNVIVASDSNTNALKEAKKILFSIGYVHFDESEIKANKCSIRYDFI